jgi:hypothetical protein
MVSIKNFVYLYTNKTIAELQVCPGGFRHFYNMAINILENYIVNTWKR